MSFLSLALKSIQVQLSSYGLRKKIIQECRISEDEEKKEIIQYLKWYKRLRTFPYPFVEKYKYDDVQVARDSEGYPYVIHNGKKMYFKKKWSDSFCRAYYTALRREQDKNAAHSYLRDDPERYPQKGHIVADIGAAEGLFSLDVIDRGIGKIYLFECDSEWNEPLKKTFSPWSDRVEIVEKYIGDKNDADNVTLDAFFENEQIDYVKADIEGMEESMLIGGEKVFAEKVRHVLLCAYHLPNAEQIIINYLQKYGFEYQVNPGYMVYMNSADGRIPPYLRRGVIYGYKVQ